MAVTSAPMSSLSKTFPLRVLGTVSSLIVRLSGWATGTLSTMRISRLVLAVPPGLVTVIAMLSVVAVAPG